MAKRGLYYDLVRQQEKHGVTEDITLNSNNTADNENASNNNNSSNDIKYPEFSSDKTATSTSTYQSSDADSDNKIKQRSNMTQG